MISNKIEPEGPSELAGPVPVEALLECVVAAVYEVEASGLDSTLAASLSQGGIYRAPYAGFLLANEHGVFLLATEPARFNFIGSEQTVIFDDDGDDYADDSGFGDWRGMR